MRTRHSLINISVGLGNQLLITLLSFFSRTVFINSLGLDYLGINGLFTNILAMLSLAEGGIGSSIIYHLYKPVADRDEGKILVLMKLYKRAYLAISGAVFILGLAVLPFLGSFTKGAHVANLHVIFLIFLVNTSMPYFFQHKISFLNVNQKTYIVTGIYSVSSIVSACLRIGILHYTQNYILYLAIDCGITLINSVILSKTVDRLYPFLKQKTNEVLDAVTKSGIIRNVKAIILQNIGAYLIFGTDNIIISSFVSVAAVGLYSNYNMLIDICRTLINQVFNNIYHSVGNLVAKESREKIYRVFKVTMFLNFWLYSFCAIFMYVVIEPFIALWLGPSFLMGKMVMIVLMVTFYERGMRNSITTVKTTAGIFHEDRYIPLVQAAINLGFSILLVRSVGIAGVFLGTLISAMLVPFWTTPYFVYRKVFQLPLLQYCRAYFRYAAAAAGTCLLTGWAAGFTPDNGLAPLIMKMLIALAVPNAVYVLLFRKTEEFAYVLGLVSGVAGGLLRRFKRSPEPAKESY